MHLVHLVHLEAPNQRSKHQLALMVENKVENNQPLTQTVSEGSNIIGVDLVDSHSLCSSHERPLSIIMSQTMQWTDRFMFIFACYYSNWLLSELLIIIAPQNSSKCVTSDHEYV